MPKLCGICGYDSYISIFYGFVTSFEQMGFIAQSFIELHVPSFLKKKIENRKRAIHIFYRIQSQELFHSNKKYFLFIYNVEQSTFCLANELLK